MRVVYPSTGYAVRIVKPCAEVNALPVAIPNIKPICSSWVEVNCNGMTPVFGLYSQHTGLYGLFSQSLRHCYCFGQTSVPVASCEVWLLHWKRGATSKSNNSNGEKVFHSTITDSCELQRSK